MGDLSRPLPRPPRHSCVDWAQLCRPSSLLGTSVDRVALNGRRLRTGGQGCAVMCEALGCPGTDTTPAQRRALASTAHTSQLLPHVSVPLPPCSGPDPQSPPSLPDTNRPEPKVRSSRGPAPHVRAQEAWTGHPCLFQTQAYPPYRGAAALEKPQVILIRTRLFQVRESLITNEMVFWSPNYEICELRERFLPNTT